VTETRTPRFNLPQWSSGSDSPSRSDFNGAFADLEARGGYDAGDSAATLPVTDLVTGRSTQLTTASDGYSMYRYNGTAWQYTGGTLVPLAVKYKAMQGQTTTGPAFTVEHPSRTTAGLTATYGGDLTAAGVLRSYDTDDDTRGVAVIGWNGVPVLGTHGRLHVRTRRTGDLGVVVQAHAADAGNLLTVRETGGQDLLTVDAAGRLTQRTFAAFGGAGLPTTSMLAISPTSSAVDGVDNGLLLYGQASAPLKSILTIRPDNTGDTTPIVVVVRDGIGLGRLPWGTPGTSSGTITYAGNTHHFRASGHASNVSYFSLRKTDVTSPATETDPTKDISLMLVTNTGISTGLPLFLSQRQRLTSVTMGLYRVSDFSAGFLELARLVPDGGGGETSQLASAWASDGRLATGAWWRGTGVTRDARQPVKHVSRKWFALPETGGESGQLIETSGVFTYTWASMTVRSPTTTDLDVVVGMEYIGVPNPGQVDTNSFLVETLISVGGGAYTVGDSTHCTMPLTQNAIRPGGNVFTTGHRIASVPANANFVLRTRITMGASTPDLRLRMLDLVATEGVHEIYAAP
jgi:hypothetical protein